MKGILLDQGLAPHAATILRRHGLNDVHVSEIGMGQAEDSQILQRARNDGSVCVTLDHDFHAHLAMAGQGRPSVVLLSVQGLDAQGQADLIRSVCAPCGDALTEGAAVPTNGESIRVRRLPRRQQPLTWRIPRVIQQPTDFGTGREASLRISDSEPRA